MGVISTWPITLTGRALAVFLFAETAMLNASSAVPQQPLASEGKLLFSDDFARGELGKSWKVTTPTFVIVDGAMKASHTQASHSAVGRVPVNRKDVIIEFKFRLDGAKVNAVCNDPQYKESHGGHICRVELSEKEIRLADDKERLRHEIVEMQKDPARRAEAAARVGR
jgi:hypothetical protein